MFQDYINSSFSRVVLSSLELNELIEELDERYHRTSQAQLREMISMIDMCYRGDM